MKQVDKSSVTDLFYIYIFLKAPGGGQLCVGIIIIIITFSNVVLVICIIFFVEKWKYI